MASRAKPKESGNPAALSPARYDRLLKALRRLLEEGKQRAELAMGQELVRTYHAVGERLLAQQQAGHAGYGMATLQRLADDLDRDRRTLQRAIAFARAYPDGPPDLGLRWAHYRELLLLPAPEQRTWYEAQAAARGWSARMLREAVREQRYRNRTTDELPEPSREPRPILRRPNEAPYLFKATIERVVDGDTLLALIDLGFTVKKSQRLRLAGIDVKALGTRQGDKALRFVQDELGRYDQVVLKTDKIDLYGRYVAHVFYADDITDKLRIFAEGEYLNQRLVDEGLAEVR